MHFKQRKLTGSERFTDWKLTKKLLDEYKSQLKPFKLSFKVGFDKAMVKANVCEHVKAVIFCEDKCTK